MMRDQSLQTEYMIGSYRLLGLIGCGPTSRVYLAERKGGSGRQVVLKLIDAAPLHAPQDQQRFLQEAFQLGYLKHPSLLPFRAAGIHQAIPYVVRDYARAGSLHEHLANVPFRLLPLNKALSLLRQVGEALVFAHEHQVVHANLKPENILMLADGQVALTDCRLHTLASAILPACACSITAARYMAPEQFRGVATALSDQYAFACLAYELLTGEVPFNALDFNTLAHKQKREDPVPPSLLNAQLPASLDRAILKSLSKQPGDRYADMRAFLSAFSGASFTSYLTTPRTTVELSPLTIENKRISQPSLVQDFSRRIRERSLSSVPAQEPLVRVLSRSESSILRRERVRQNVRVVLPVSTPPWLKKSEIAVLTAMVFLLERLSRLFRKCREMVSLALLVLCILWEMRGEIWAAGKAWVLTGVRRARAAVLLTLSTWRQAALKLLQRRQIRHQLISPVQVKRRQRIMPHQRNPF